MRGRRSGAASPKVGWFPAVIVVALTFVLRLWIAHSVAQSPLLTRPVLGDAQYLADAQKVEDTGSFGNDLPAGSPLYALWLEALPGKVRALPATLPLVQSVLDALTAGLLFAWIAGRFGTRAGTAAALLFALDPLGGVFAARLIPVSLGQLVLVGALSLASRLEDSESAPLRLIQGLLLVLGVVLLPMPFLLLSALLISRAWRAGVGGRARVMALLVAPIVLISGLFLFRNAIKTDGPPALSWGSGLSCYHAFDPTTGGTLRSLTPPSWEEEGATRAVAWEALQREGTTKDLLRFYWVRGFQRLLENPVGTLAVLLTKAAASLGAAPVPDGLAPGFLLARAVPFLALGRFAFALFLALGIGGWIALRGDRAAAPLGLGLLALALACLLGPTSAAARQPATGLLAGLAGAWLLGPKRAENRLPWIVAAGAFFLSIALGAVSPTAALQNPSEDIRLLAIASGAQQGGKRVESLLSESLRANPKNLEARVALANAYLRDQLNDRAQEELEKAYAADSTHAGTLFSLSRMAQARGDNPAAARFMGKIVNQRPTNPLYLNELGQLLVVMGQMGDAKNLFIQALRLKPDYQVARTNLEAVETYEQRLEESLYPPEMRLAADDPLDRATPEIVNAMERQDWEKADSLLSWAERTRPDLVLPHWLRAGYHGRRNELPQAIAQLEECQRLAPGRPTIVELLANLYVQSGQREKAERLLAASLVAAKDDAQRVASLEAIRAAMNTPPPR